MNWSPPAGSDAANLLRSVRGALMGRHPMAWTGFDSRVELADRHDLEPHELRMRFNPAGIPSPNDDEILAGVDPDEWRYAIGPVWCAPGPSTPTGLQDKCVREGDAIWVHTPWGTFPCWTWEQVINLLMGAILLSGIDIARYIDSLPEPRPLWPWTQTECIVPTAIPEGQRALTALQEYLGGDT